jgi:hypothetical protein
MAHDFRYACFIVSTKEYARKWHTLSDLAPMNPLSQQSEPEQGEKRSMSVYYFVNLLIRMTNGALCS